MGLTAAAIVPLAIEVGRLLPWLSVSLGHDYRIYIAAAASWASGGPFYHPYQLAGAYPIVNGEVLYPPTILPLLLPFIVLPAVLWWVLPLGLLAWSVAAWRPAPWAWAAMAWLLLLPSNALGYGQSLDLIVNGNPGIWVAAFVVAGLRWGWGGPLVLLKPTMVPFALAGVRSRSWWIALAALIGLSLLMLPLWRDYAVALLNVRGGRDPWYTVDNVPLLLIPVVAWLARDRTAVRDCASAA
ncbi:MAG: hypothetical protein ACYDCI_05730 [Candidatus Limnocylindrales bacterium]